MRDIEGIEKVIEKLAPFRVDIDEHFKSENERFKGFMEKEHDLPGLVLKCHLIVENYLERYLSVHYGIEEIESARLTFFQKAKLLPDTASSSAFIKPGVVELNVIRNHIGHDLDTVIEPHNLVRINQVLKIAREGVEFEDVGARIEAFTTVACTFLIVAPKKLEDAFMDAFSEIRVNREGLTVDETF